jgi:hypothetical protein
MITNKSGLLPQTLKTEDQRSLKRQSLQSSAEKYMAAIQEQVGDLRENGKNALIIGGVVLAGYFLTELLLPNADDNETEEPQRNRRFNNDEEDSLFFSMLKGVATTVLLTLAREKLMKLLDGLPENEPATTK